MKLEVAIFPPFLGCIQTLGHGYKTSTFCFGFPFE